jgi:cyclophilin family peptidyl-prolyl cis-trans isomerase
MIASTPTQSNTRARSEFSYEVDGQRHYVTPPPGNANNEQFMILAGASEGFRVRCEITVQSQLSMDSLDIIVKPYWAPRGAARFLELVRSKYYDGVVFNRVVPNFLTQFGIAKDYATRTKERELTIWDDFPKGIKFEPGMLSFAGSGHDSRTTEIFVVMPGVSEEQAAKFGANSWEVPFAVIDGDVNKSALPKIYSEYGDMPPFANGECVVVVRWSVPFLRSSSFHVLGQLSPSDLVLLVFYHCSGPDSSKIYEADGYKTYLPKKFPQLDYVDSCYIVDEVGISDGQEL